MAKSRDWTKINKDSKRNCISRYCAYNVSNTYRIINEENNAKIRNSNEDYVLRTELHGIILARVKAGITKEEILKEISEIERFSKYKDYLENWVEDKIKKEEALSKRKNKTEKEK